MQRYLKTENSQLRCKQRLLIEKKLNIVIYTNIVSLTYREQCFGRLGEGNAVVNCFQKCIFDKSGTIDRF